MGIYYLWKLSDAELYRRSSQPKYLVIICIKVAPGKPRATLCLALQKDSSVGPLPARDKKKTARDRLPLGCGAAAVQKRLPPTRSPLLRGKSLFSAHGHSQQPGRKKQKANRTEKKKKEKRNHIFMLGQCPNL